MTGNRRGADDFSGAAERAVFCPGGPVPGTRHEDGRWHSPEWRCRDSRLRTGQTSGFPRSSPEFRRPGHTPLSLRRPKFLYKWNEDHSFLKRNVDIHDVGNSALYLLSNLANGVTGEIHYVDAGYNKVGMPDPKNMS